MATSRGRVCERGSGDLLRHARPGPYNQASRALILKPKYLLSVVCGQARSLEARQDCVSLPAVGRRQIDPGASSERPAGPAAHGAVRFPGRWASIAGRLRALSRRSPVFTAHQRRTPMACRPKGAVTFCRAMKMMGDRRKTTLMTDSTVARSWAAAPMRSAAATRCSIVGVVGVCGVGGARPRRGAMDITRGALLAGHCLRGTACGAVDGRARVRSNAEKDAPTR